jgi:hypothetical protein
MSTLYLIVQQPAQYDADADTFEATDFVWYGTVKTAPTTDPVTSLDVTADAASSGTVILDGMTIMISSSAYGRWERGILAAHGDQTILGAGNDDTLYIAVASDLSGVQVGDFVVVLDEFRFRTLYPKITESGGSLSWYKYYGANRRQACQPAVPIMSSHVVQFIDPDIGSVDIDFNWTECYSVATGATVNAWTAVGETDHVGGTWNSAVQNPGDQTYNTLSGLRGFRVTLEIGTDLTDPIAEFRRGVRYVFTLRHPDKLQSGDPADAAPITDFTFDSISGSFDQGGWSTEITVFADQASQYQIAPGALVIIFAEDIYGSTKESVGPNNLLLTDRENIVMVGHIADDSIRKESETGDVSFTVVSTSELMKNRENYPVPIENDDGADEWYKAPDLTIDRASHHYLRWHTNLCLVCDLYETADVLEVKAMDFLAGDSYSTIDQFIQDRLFARLLCDRFDRFKMGIDQQLKVAGTAQTLFTLTDADWMDEIELQEVNERPVSVADTGGILYIGGNVLPYLSHAPGDVSGYVGTPEQRMSLAIGTQANLNTICGRLYAYRNNRWPRLTVPMAGNWRTFDIWPQEYVVVNLETERHTFSSDLFIVREVTIEHDSALSSLLTVLTLEAETDGPAGVTIEIPPELPGWTTPPTTTPPGVPPTPGNSGYVDSGRRIISTKDGVIVTDDIGSPSPYWYLVDNGLASGHEWCWDFKRDPWHWWTTTNEAKLWAIFGDGTWLSPYLYYMENFPNGTWTLSYTGLGSRPHLCDIIGSIEVEDTLYLLRYAKTWGGAGGNLYVHRTVDGGTVWTQLVDLGQRGGQPTWPNLSQRLAIAQHSGAQNQHVAGNDLHSTKYGAWTLNEWAAFTLDTDYPHGVNDFGVPYINASWNDTYLVARHTNGAIDISLDSGANWTQIGDPGATSYALSVFDGAVGYMVALYNDATAKTTIDNGATWATWVNIPAGTWSPYMLTKWKADGAPENILAHNNTDNEMYLIHAAGADNKTGNLHTVSPNLDYVTRIDRDTRGSA